MLRADPAPAAVLTEARGGGGDRRRLPVDFSLLGARRDERYDHPDPTSGAQWATPREDVTWRCRHGALAGRRPLAGRAEPTSGAIRTSSSARLTAASISSAPSFRGTDWSFDHAPPHALPAPAPAARSGGIAEAPSQAPDTVGQLIAGSRSCTAASRRPVAAGKGPASRGQSAFRMQVETRGGTGGHRAAARADGQAPARAPHPVLFDEQ